MTALEISSFAHPMDEKTTAQLGFLLPEYIASRRWFRSKTRNIQQVTVTDALQISETNAYLLVLDLTYAEGSDDRYILPLSIGRSESSGGDELVAELTEPGGEKGFLYSSLVDESFRTGLLKLIWGEQTLSGQHGQLTASRTSVAVQTGALPELQSFVSRAEQSNTSIIYGDQYILKLFRKLEAGVNPDIEIGRFLTEHGFQQTPAVLGSLEYRSSTGGAAYAVGLLQQFVENQGDTWKYTLDSLGVFFPRAFNEPAPPLPSENSFDLMEHDPEPGLQRLIGAYLRSAALLGRRTAQMHAALASDAKDTDFVPEPFQAGQGITLYGEMLEQAAITFDLLRRKQSELKGEVAEEAAEVIALEQQVLDRFTALRDRPLGAVRIRHHGDYHLGQVLYTGQDFMIIDFEGEPARPLAQRRAKALALRDVAGMLRSFQYAAYAALFGQVPGVSAQTGTAASVEDWAEVWNAWVCAAYLKAYFAEAQGFPFIPESTQERRLLLDAFLLQKALYEVAYELNNRPDWLLIPLRGILSLVS